MGGIEHIANLRGVAQVLHAIGANPNFPESRAAATQMAKRIEAATDYFLGTVRCDPATDTLGAFLAARVAPARKSHVTACELYALYTRWCAARGIAAMTMTMFTREVEWRGYKRGITRCVRVWIGIDVIHGGEEDDIAAWKARAAQRYVTHGGVAAEIAAAFSGPTWSGALEAENGNVPKALASDPIAAVDDDLASWEA